MCITNRWKILFYFPNRRITAEQALAHEYLAQYADPTDEPVSAPYDQSFEDMDLPVDKWKGKFGPTVWGTQQFIATSIG